MKKPERKPYILLAQGGNYELIEKKSRFLAESIPVSTEEEILSALERIRKTHYDARHHCYAYCYGENYENTRISDDGEPTGTAGKPIFDVLKGIPVTGCLIVVTRYFGGTLLGTGGLVRAYGGAAREAMAASSFRKMLPAERFSLSLDYGDWGKLQHFFSGQEIIPYDQAFTDRVSCRVRVKEEAASGFLKGITELFAGRLIPQDEGEDWIEEVYFPQGGKISETN